PTRRSSDLTSTQTTNWLGANQCRREPPRHPQNTTTTPTRRTNNAHRTPVFRGYARPTATHHLLRRPCRHEARSQCVEVGLREPRHRRPDFHRLDQPHSHRLRRRPGRRRPLETTGTHVLDRPGQSRAPAGPATDTVTVPVVPLRRPCRRC